MTTASYLSVPSGSPAGRMSMRERILREAELVFAEHGYAGGSLDKIADCVGIRRPSVLHHFPSKRALYDQVERDIFCALEARLPAADVDASALSELVDLLDAWFLFWAARPTAARIVMRNIADREGRIHDPLEFSGGALERFEAIVAKGVASGEFGSIDPAVALNILGTAGLAQVCNAIQLGDGRHYDPADRATAAVFLRSLHAAARAIMLAEPPPDRPLFANATSAESRPRPASPEIAAADMTNP